MFGIGGFELFLILLFGFLIFGPDKLPAMAKTLGKAINKFRSAQEEMNKVLKTEVYDPTSDEPFKNPLEALSKVAEGEKKSRILRADAAKQAAIKKAEGEAEAILKVQQATAEAIKLLNEADPREAVLRIKALEAFQAAADGKATKIIIPSEIQGLAGMCASAKAVFDSVAPNKPKPPTESN